AAHLDTVNENSHSTVTLLRVLLVTAPRVQSLLDANVSALDRDERRLKLGDDVGNKHKGAAVLDAGTFDELARCVGKRKTGPLLLSPEDCRHRQEKVRARY